MGQAAEFAAESWIIRQPPKVYPLGWLMQASLEHSRLCDALEKLPQDGGSQSPDIMPVHRVEMNRMHAALVPPVLLAPDGRIAQNGKGRFYDFGDLRRVYPERIGIGEGSHEGSDPVTGDGNVIVQSPEDCDIGRADPHFLLRLPQCGLKQVGIFCMTDPAGEGDFPPVVLHQFGPAGEEKMVLSISGKERNQNGGGSKLAQGDTADGVPGEGGFDVSGIEHHTFMLTAFSEFL